MSAICGIIHFDGKPVDPCELEQMVASSPYRGPDGVKFHVAGNAGFAYLAFHVTPESVYDAQPWVDPESGLVLVADARIDNREELNGTLSEELSRLSPILGKFETPGGTPVAIPDSLYILAAWRKWGEACVERLLGDFVFAAWDSAKQSLFLARDALGSFGASYRQSGNSLYFASEISAILDQASFEATVNEVAVAKTLAGMALAPEETFFMNLWHVPPAHSLAFSPSGQVSRQYWSHDSSQIIRYQDEQEYTDHFLELLDAAVICRLRRLGPAGLSLSGGHDSTLIAAVAAPYLAASGDRLKSFSYVFDRFQDCDEREYIEPVERHFGLDASYLAADDCWTFSEQSLRSVPRDFFWTNPYAGLPEMAAQAAGSSGCRLLLDGMFGDALFCEPSLFAAELMRRGRLASLFSLAWRHRDKIDINQEFYHYGIRQLVPQSLRRILRKWLPRDIATDAPGLSNDWLKSLSTLAQQDHERIAETALTPGRRNRFNRVFQSLWAQGFAATRSEPYNRLGVERLSPYFDRRLVAYILSVPCEQVSHPGAPRRLQRNAMFRLLPAKTALRETKTGYEPLLRYGLAKKRRQLIASAGDSQVVRQGWIDEVWLRERLSADQWEADGYFLAACLHLEMWLNAIEAPLSGRSSWSSSL